ncbi:unnamed protein product [Didymodactylos carnosus]|uniref:Uncharacterized protein n=1 Tax=Didymodactylos carnosus TaxID=1234261 RepID=A0A8S2WQD8_9BILA|nr:unnamed protein product [Didymodactylos carnosus]CAF4456625.1 unnamed protein product [Didymodactylos carnosus]
MGKVPYRSKNSVRFRRNGDNSGKAIFKRLKIYNKKLEKLKNKENNKFELIDFKIGTKRLSNDYGLKSQNLTTYFESNRNKPLIKVTFTSDPAVEHFDIVINDLGGGVADEEQEKTFEYMYTGQSEYHEKTKPRGWCRSF